jgi:hypothetical protein
MDIIIKKLYYLALGCMVQPGAGHDMPSGIVSLKENKNKIKKDTVDDLWWDTFILREGPPIGTNDPVPQYRGPLNNREKRRLPVRTIKDFRPKSKLKAKEF